MKYIALILAISATVTIGSLVRHNKQDNFSKIQLENIEALAGDEKSHHWCCGETSECLIAPNVIIIGKLRNYPC